MIQIPITNQPNQSFRVSMPQGEINLPLSFYVYWNRTASYWQMDIQSIATGDDLIVGLPLLSAEHPAQNILEQFEYLDIGEAYVVPVSANPPTSHPLENDWDSNYILLWGP